MYLYELYIVSVKVVPETEIWLQVDTGTGIKLHWGVDQFELMAVCISVYLLYNR